MKKTILIALVAFYGVFAQTQVIRETTAPTGNPSPGYGTCWFDTVTHQERCRNSAGVITEVQPPLPASASVIGTNPSGNPVAQTNVNGVTQVTTNPSTCTPGTTGDVWNTTTTTRYYCSATNTWTASGNASPLSCADGVNCTFPGTVSVGKSVLMPPPANSATVDTSAAINAMLASFSTGGTLTLGAGVWYITSSICVPSNVVLQGTSGTIIQPRAGAKTPCVVGGQSWGGAVVVAGASNVVVQDITIDQATNGSTDNGIEVGYSATPLVRSSNVVIRRNLVLQVGGATGVHQYGVWANGSASVKILANYTNGNVSSPSAAGVDEDGIEALGATDILIDGNTCINHNGNGIGIFASSTGVTITNNTLLNNTVGIAANGNAANTISNVAISTNRITTTASYGIYATQLNTGVTDGLQIQGNILDGTAGIIVDGVSGSVWNSVQVNSNTVKNTVTVSTLGGAIAAVYANGVSILGNTITTSDYAGIRADVSTGLVIENNNISATANKPIFLNSSTIAKQISLVSLTDLVCAHGGDTINSVACGNTLGTDGTTEQTFATGWSVPVGWWASGTTIRVCGQFQSWSSTTAANLSNIGLYTGSGPITLVAHGGTMSTTAAMAGYGWSMCWRLSSTTDAGDHIWSQFESDSYPKGAAFAFFNTATQPTNPGNTAQTLKVFVKWAATGVKSAVCNDAGGKCGLTGLTGTVGQTINLQTFNGTGCVGTLATVALTGTDTIANGTALTITNTGYACSAVSTSAAYVAGGTAAASGNATITSVLGGAQGNGILKPFLTVERIQ